jgi:DNA-binding response OmpR family regulator
MTGALRRILVIEDDAKTAAQIVGFLTTRGYEAHTRLGLCVRAPR